MKSRETWLATVLVDLADSADSDVENGRFADKLVACLAELLTPAEVGLVMAGEDGELTVAAATGLGTWDLLAAELAHGEGPTVTCFRSGAQSLNARLDAMGTPWYRTTARAAGYTLVSAVPMRRRDTTIGAVCVLVADGAPLAEPEISLARNLAEAATVGIVQQRLLRRSLLASEQLQHALDSRVLIEQAKGMVAARLGISPDEAFGLIRGYARRQQRRLADVARDVTSQVLPAPELLGDTARRRPAPRA